MSAVTQRRVARALRAGGTEVIEVSVEQLAPLKVDEALVRVEAAGLNHAETLIRSGNYAVRLPFPYPLGGEGSGIVVATGPDVAIPMGSRVCWGAVLGSCATLVMAPASMLVPIPDGLSFEESRAWRSPGSPPVFSPAFGRCKWSRTSMISFVKRGDGVPLCTVVGRSCISFVAVVALSRRRSGGVGGGATCLSAVLGTIRRGRVRGTLDARAPERFQYGDLKEAVVEPSSHVF